MTIKERADAARNRRTILDAAGILFATTSVGNALAPTFGLFIAWRMLGGVAIGLASSLSPMYISEIAPALFVKLAEALAPNGVAYVSYNTLPGWALPGGVRLVLAGVALGCGLALAGQHLLRGLLFGVNPWNLWMLAGTVVLVGALTYVPALALGPVIEHLQLHAGQLF